MDTEVKQDNIKVSVHLPDERVEEIISTVIESHLGQRFTAYRKHQMEKEIIKEIEHILTVDIEIH